MPDVDDLLEELGAFASHPPVAPTEVEALRERGRRARRTRRVVAGSAAIVSAVALLGVGAVIFADDDDHTLDVGDPTTVATVATTTPDFVTDHDAVASPNENLEDGSEISVEFARPPNVEVTGQCAVEAVVGENVDASWCDTNVRPAVTTEASLGVPFEVVRMIETSHGLIDCAERPGRCVIGAYAIEGDPMWAVLSFRSDLPPVEEPHLFVDRAEADDGETITLLGYGFVPGEEVFVTQCVGPDVPDCDLARARRTEVDAEGAFAFDFVASSEILTYDGWRACEPCELRATEFRMAPASDGITVHSGPAPRRPRVEISGEGPYPFGQRATLLFSDFQIGAEPTVGWCNVPASADEHPNCVYPNEGFGVVVDADATFVRTDFPLPDEAWSVANGCLEQCVLAWHPGEGSPAAFETPFVMQP